jgi:glucose-1-phosphate thymidylyltransferase
LLTRLDRGEADVVLGLFPTDQPQQVGVVDIDANDQVIGIYEKSSLTHLPYMWAIAVWRPSFTQFLHEYVEERLKALMGQQVAQQLRERTPYQELPIGDVIHAAIQAGMGVEAETFASGHCIDIGTPDNLILAIRQRLCD